MNRVKFVRASCQSCEEIATASFKRAAELEQAGQIVLRYAEDCNGSVGDVAGVCSESGNVLGLMPHPDRAFEAELGSADGSLLFQSALASA